MNVQGQKTNCYRCGNHRKCRVVNIKTKKIHSKVLRLIGTGHPKRIPVCRRCEKKGTI